jgi:hypothetical protein
MDPALVPSISATGAKDTARHDGSISMETEQKALKREMALLEPIAKNARSRGMCVGQTEAAAEQAAAWALTHSPRLAALVDALKASSAKVGVAPFGATAWHDGKNCFAGADEASRAKVAAMTDEEVQRVAQAEGLALMPAVGTSTGYKGVTQNGCITKPFKAQTRVEGTKKNLGCFATAAEAALAYARHLGPQASTSAALAQMNAGAHADGVLLDAVDCLLDSTQDPAQDLAAHAFASWIATGASVDLPALFEMESGALAEGEDDWMEPEEEALPAEEGITFESQNEAISGWNPLQCGIMASFTSPPPIHETLAQLAAEEWPPHAHVCVSAWRMPAHLRICSSAPALVTGVKRGRD